MTLVLHLCSFNYNRRTKNHYMIMMMMMMMICSSDVLVIRIAGPFQRPDMLWLPTSVSHSSVVTLDTIRYDTILYCVFDEQ